MYVSKTETDSTLFDKDVKFMGIPRCTFVGFSISRDILNIDI